MELFNCQINKRNTKSLKVILLIAEEKWQYTICIKLSFSYSYNITLIRDGRPLITALKALDQRIKYIF